MNSKEDTIVNVESNYRQMQDEGNIVQMRDQEKEVRRLENHISDVNELFNKFGDVLEKQGETIDSIEANFERTDEYVSEGARQIRQASAYQNRLRRKRFICLSLIAFLTALLLYYIYWEFQN